MTTFREKLNVGGTVVFGMLLLIGGGHQLFEYLSGGEPRSNSAALLMCPEPLMVVSHEKESLGLDVVFENMAEVALSDNIRAWMYGKDEVFLGSVQLYDLRGTLPGQKTKAHFMLADGATKVIFCSLNPMNPPSLPSWQLKRI